MMNRLKRRLVIAGGVAVGVALVRRVVGRRRRAARVEQAEPMLGALCEIRSRKVRRRAGAATGYDGQSDRDLKVRAVKGQTLRRGETARILSYDPQTDVYEVKRVGE